MAMWTGRDGGYRRAVAKPMQMWKTRWMVQYAQAEMAQLPRSADIQEA